VPSGGGAMMTFRVIPKPSNNHVRCPYRVIERTTGREIGWINEYLDVLQIRFLRVLAFWSK
jgi:hypothetical protein